MSITIEDIDKKFNLANEHTPFNVYLTPHYKKSLAYSKIHDSLPKILTSRVDLLSRTKEEIVNKYGPVATDEIEQVIGNLSQLKYELQTDKEFDLFDETTDEFKQWNKFINDIEGINGRKSYFSTPWLYSEALMYRKLKLFFEKTSTLKDFDYFKDTKDETLVGTLPSIKAVASYLDKCNPKSDQEKHDVFIYVLKLNLWANLVDLSVSSGTQMEACHDLSARIPQLDEFILANHTEEIWLCLKEKSGDAEVAIICDNAGYELFTDLVLAETMLSLNLVKKVVYHLKAIPWYVSDALESDFEYVLNFLETHEFEALLKLGKKLRKRITEGEIVINKPVDLFWTTGYEFAKMKEIDPDLYNRLSQPHLLIFKGDLNYRKLMSDQNWEPTTPFKTALKGFQPTNLCTLRTVKADMISGLHPGVAEKLTKGNRLWMDDGDYAVIQFSHK